MDPGVGDNLAESPWIRTIWVLSIKFLLKSVEPCRLSASILNVTFCEFYHILASTPICDLKCFLRLVSNFHSNTMSSLPWPDSVTPERSQRFFRDFFALLDDESESGAKNYSQLFTEDAAYYVLGNNEFHGRKSR